jgi:peroxiredoxin-like protein
MSIEHNYMVDLTWKNDRKGILTSPELNSEIEVVTPPEFPKGMPGIWSPEHLLVAAVNSCLMTTFLSIAENSKLLFDSFSSKASGKLEMIDGKYIISEITLKPLLSIEHEMDRERAARVLNKTEPNCLISNSVKSKIIFEPEIRVLQN